MADDGAVPPPDATAVEGPGGFQFRPAIVEMVRQGASDLLLKAGRPPTVRVNGQLKMLEMPALRPDELKTLAESLMTPRQLRDFADTKEADFGIGVPGIGRFRTNVYQQRGTVAFALRGIPYEVRTIRELLLPTVLEEVAMRPRGLVLVTGITGSGKSTTLAAVIEHINRHRRVNVITIEDPIEFLHRDQYANVSQREVGSDTVSFGHALRHVLRQDPDVILIGEIRDMETMDTALKAADTGPPGAVHDPHHRRDPDDLAGAVVLPAAPARRDPDAAVDRAGGGALDAAGAAGRRQGPGAGLRDAGQHRRGGREHPRHPEGARRSPS